MKKSIIALAMVCAAIFSTQPLFAQQTICPSKKEIRETINTMSNSLIYYAQQHRPVSLIKQMMSLYDWYDGLDQSTHKYTLKQLSKWTQEHKEMIKEHNDYINITDEIFGSEQYDTYPTQSVVNIYLDTVYEYIGNGDTGSALKCFMECTTLLYYRRATGEEDTYTEVWAANNPNRASTIFSAIGELYTEEWFMANVGNRYGENYLAMSESELQESYIKHVEDLALSYNNQHWMDMTRHFTIITFIADLVEDVDILNEMEKRWIVDNPELAESLDEAYDIFL